MVAPLLLAALLQETPLPEGNAFARGLVESHRRREEALDDYAYDILEVREELDGRGRVERRRTRLVQVFHVKGRPVRRTVEEDGRPLPPARQRKEDERARRHAQGLARGEVLTKRPRITLSRLLERFDFRSVAREEVEGRAAILLEISPLSGKGGIEGDEVLRHLAGRVWVDEVERHVVRADLRSTEAIKVALGLGARVSEMRLLLEFRKVDDAVWLPLRVETEAAGRAFLFKRFRFRMTATYGSYRRFQVESEEAVRD